MLKSKIVSRKSKIRMGVVGLGNFGRLHALTLAGLAEAELVALVDKHEVALAELGQQLPGVHGWTNFADALQEAEAEAWIIATRTEAHVPSGRAEFLPLEGMCSLKSP